MDNMPANKHDSIPRKLDLLQEVGEAGAAFDQWE